MDEFQLEPGWLEREIKRTNDYCDNTTLRELMNPPTNRDTRSPYISIDLETTGLDPDNCQILEFGAVIEDWCSPIERLPVFHAFLCHSRILGEAYALQMNHKILKKIADKKDADDPNAVFITEPYHLMHQFSEWLEEQGIAGKITAAGKNFGAFDLQFLKRNGLGPVQFRHRFIDPGGMFYNPAIDDVPPDTAECMRRAGIPGGVVHTAVEDAITIIQLVRHVAGVRGEFGAMEIRRST